MANSKRFEKQLASKVVLGVGVEKDDRELGWWSLQMMPDLNQPTVVGYEDLSRFSGKVGVTMKIHYWRIFK